MNKILLAIIAVLTAVIVFMACNGKELKKEEGITQKPEKPAACDEKICMFYDDEDIPGTISGALLQELSVSYYDDHAKSMLNYAADPATDTRDACSVTFSLEKLKNLIWHIETSVCKSGCDTSRKLGIRFYYIKYPAVVGPESRYEEFKYMDKTWGGKHSLAMVPAFRKDNLWYDFDYAIPGKGCELTPLTVNSKHGGLVIAGDGTNHGGIAPPPGRGYFPTNPE